MYLMRSFEEFDCSAGHESIPLGGVFFWLVLSYIGSPWKADCHNEAINVASPETITVMN